MTHPIDWPTVGPKLLEALEEITPAMPPADAPCHHGLISQEKCGHCRRIAQARAAIAAAKGEDRT